MELKDYLAKSKEKRDDILKVANRYLNQSISGDALYKKKLFIVEDDAFNGPNPKRLKEFEVEVGDQLKKMFKPEHNSNSKMPKILFPSINVNERIRKVYMKSLQKNKKPLIILPRNSNFTPMKITSQITKGKYMQNSPYRMVTRSEIKKINITPEKSCDKNLLLLPVLSKSIVGNRSKTSDR